MEEVMDLVTGKELGKRLGGVNYHTLMRWAEMGLIPSIKIGRLRKFDVEKVINCFEDGSFERARKRKSRTVSGPHS